MSAHKGYLPAAGHDLFLPLYDPLTTLLGAHKDRLWLVERAELAPGQRVLDVGCGTGTLLVAIKQRMPGLDVVGLDPDAKALARAARKAGRAGVAVRFDQGFADELPYADGSFDRVLSSFMFHHLLHEQKGRMLAEARRVLKPGGRLELLDFAGSKHTHRGLSRLFHRHEMFADNDEDPMRKLLQEAGFRAAPAIEQRQTWLGTAVRFGAVN